MFSISNLAVITIHLFSLTKAAPKPISSQWRECPPSTQFYTCSLSNFAGCCSVDPCALQSGCPDSTNSAPASYPVEAKLTTCEPGTKAYQQFNPFLRTIGAPTSDSSLFHIANDTRKGLDVQQVFSFGNIPATASNIGLFWSISATSPEFKTVGSATGAVTLLDSSKLDLKAAVITAEQVVAAVDGSVFENGAVGGAGFGFWDGAEFKRPHNHIVRASGLPTREVLSFWIRIRDEGEVTIRQTERDGLYLQYDC